MMIKAKELKKGDKIAIVSLSKGILGETFIKHELDIAIDRLEKMGLEVIIMPNALKGITYLDNHPEARAEDLKTAFKTDEVKAIISAIGGEDTYRLLPFLMDDKEFINNVKKHPKIFIGFSDTTINHLMFYKLGLITFYGPALITDLAELDKEMLPYTEKYFKKLFSWDDKLKIISSNVWYLDRKKYDLEEVGKSREIKKEEHGFELLNGFGIVEGELFGGCLDSFNDILTNKLPNEKETCMKYNLIPNKNELEGKILFLETSEMRMKPNQLLESLNILKKYGFFDTISGLLIGKPIDELYYDEYKKIYKDFFSDKKIPILYNINFGHAVPRCIIPYGVKVHIDCRNREIIIIENPLEKEN